MKRKINRAKSQALMDMKSQGDLYPDDFDKVVREESFSNPSFERNSFVLVLFFLLVVLITLPSCEKKLEDNKGDSYYVGLTLKKYPDWDITKAEDYLFMSDSTFLSTYYGPLNKEDAVYNIYTEKDVYFVNNTHLAEFYWVTTESGHAFKLAKYELNEWLNNTIIPEKVEHFAVFVSSL